MFRRNKIFVLILILAAFLRFIGTNPGYSRYHSDEPIIYGTAIDMVKNNSIDPGRFDYPATEAFINFLFFKFIFIPTSWTVYYVVHIPQIIDGVVHIPITPLEADRIFHTSILGPKEVYPMFWARYVTALFSVGNVALIYFIGKKLFKKEVGLMAAFFLALDFKNVVNSHIGLPDVYNSFFLLLALLMAIVLWKKPSWKSYLVAGIAAGLSFSGKYQLFGLLPIFVAHFYLSIENKRVNIKKIFNPAFVAALFCIPVTFALLNPYFFVHFETALSWVQGVSVKYSVGTDKLNFFPFSYLYHIDFGPVEFVIFVLGTLFTTFKFAKKSLFLWVIILPFLFSFCYYTIGGFYVRNLITVIPIFLLLAANLMWNLFERYKVVILILPLMLLIPARNSFINTYYYTKGWNYQVLSDWLFNNLPAGNKLASHPFDPPTGTPLYDRTEFQINGSYSLAEHKENGADYALINLDWGGDSFYGWMSFGPDKIKKYWSKPVDELRNTFFGLASEELFRYQIFSVTKPWQAPDSDLVLAKLPVWPNIQMKVLKHFGFDTDGQGWSLIGSLGNKKVEDLRQGKNSSGSLYLYQSSTGDFAVARETSELIPVRPGHLYEATGFLKVNKILTVDKRDGFIRMDFYGSNSDTTKVGLISTVSSRISGTSDWVKKTLIERAPEGAKYLTVSLQKINEDTSVWLDDLDIKESEGEIDDITQKLPYNIKGIDLNLLYPNSHGNL